MFGPVWTVTALACAAPLPATPRDEEAGKPRLIVKGKDYFLHALPPKPNDSLLKPGPPGVPDKQTAPDGIVLLHTSIKTGEMKVLAASHTLSYRGPPTGIDRTFFIRSVVVGVAADEERLFVLVLETRSGQIYLPAQTSYHLLVFRPDNGVLVHTLDVKPEEPPKERPAETADRGPLLLRGDGVSCLGVKFEFKGTQLVGQQSEGKKP
jgi:hypothetical protein